MTRAGVVKHPSEWAHSGYREIQRPPDRYGIIDLAALSELSGVADVADLQKVHWRWVAEALTGEIAGREARWSEAIAVGSSAFVDDVKNGLGIKAMHREVLKAGQTHELREQGEVYAGHFDGKSEALRLYNAIPWEENTANSEG